VALFYSWSGLVALLLLLCFHKSSPNGSLLLLLLILSLVGVAQWHFATPVSSQEFAQWLILVTTAVGTEWPNGTLLLLCFSQESAKWLTLVTF
jgi:hypothetical protein